MAGAYRFWHDATPESKDPKRGYRWILLIGSLPAYTLKKVAKPSFTVTETPHKYLNHTYYYPGRVEWNTIELTLADPVEPDMAATVTNIIKNAGYSPAQMDTDLQTMSKRAAVAHLGDTLEIRQIDSEGKLIEGWKLHNPWIKDVKYGDLDYESDDLTEITIELRYDWAELETMKPGHATNAGTEAGTEYWSSRGAGGGKAGNLE